jgi:hypothetical protein
MQKPSKEQSTSCIEPNPTINPSTTCRQHAFLHKPIQSRFVTLITVATTKQRQQAAERRLYYANSILRGSSIYSFTLTGRPHNNKNNPISRLFGVQHQDDRWVPRTEECHGLSSIQQPVVVCQSYNHYRPYHDLSIYDNWSILSCVHPYRCHTLHSDRGVPSRHNITTYPVQRIEAD